MYTRLISFSLQLIIWFFFIGIPLMNDPQHFVHDGAMIRYLLRHGLYVVFFYANYFYFIPKILKKKGLSSYMLITLGSMLFVFFLGSLSEGWLLHRPAGSQMLMGLVPLIQVYALSTTFRLTLDYFDQLTKQKQLEEQGRIAELNFLRSQINPHFLFNTLNNINALIRLNPDEAERSIGSLSELMRYMLNSGKQEKIELGKEIAYINSYVELQKLRLPPDFKLKYEITVSDETVQIEPLLLIGFIENTFKHGISGAEDDFIEIIIKSDTKFLSLEARNKIHDLRNIDGIISGVGLKNTRKRLQLCYRNKYSLQLNTDKNIYDIKLKLEL
jgi:two-component system LytT family sensor kinase